MRLFTVFLAAIFLAALTPEGLAQKTKGRKAYEWEKELNWKIRLNRGPVDCSGDLDTAVRLLKRAKAPEKDIAFYSAAYNKLVSRPENTFADLRSDAGVRKILSKDQRLLSGGPMLGSLSSDGAGVWVRTVAPAEIKVEVDIKGKTKRFGPVYSTQASDLSAVVPISGLKPQTCCRCRVLVEGEECGNVSLTTAPPDNAQTVMRIAFGGDFHRWGMAHKPLFDRILERKPAAMLLVGDIAVQDRFTHFGLHRADYLLRDLFPDWRRLVASTPVYATWDDHDYFENDLGGIPKGVTAAQRITVREVFRNSWNNPAYGLGDDGGGIFFRTRIGPADIIMLDNKFFRNDGKDSEKRTLLGKAQSGWLKRELLKCEAPFKILSCGTMWSDHVSNGKDSWGKFDPRARREIFELIVKNRIAGVLLISGDRHGACGYRIPLTDRFSLYEFNVGSLGGISGNRAPAGKAPEAEGLRLYRFGEGYAFGEFEFDTRSDDPVVTFRLIKDDGSVIHAQSFKRSELTPPVNTRMMTEAVFRKGVQHCKLDFYAGTLMLHGMSEFCLLEGNDELQREIVDIYRKFGSGRIKACGNFISYEAKDFFAAVLKHQDAQGLWHQEMTDPTPYVETSGSGLLLYGLGLVIEKGIIDAKHLADFKQGIAGFAAYVSRDVK